jgi:hypothetical protein
VSQVVLRGDGLMVDRPTRAVAPARADRARVVEWKARRVAPNAMWVAVVVPDGDLRRRREIVGTLAR